MSMPPVPALEVADTGPIVASPSAADAPRIAAIDAVRGLAVLGILVMNVVEFAWPFEAYENPAYAGGSEGADLATWFVQVTLFDGKMRALFSMLFGAGLVLLADRLVHGGRGAFAADLLLRRCLWLVPFGMLHRFLLQWSGDILYQYGLLGLLAVAFRNLRARTLILLGVLVLALSAPGHLLTWSRLCALRDSAHEADVVERGGGVVPPELEAARRRWRARVASIPPPAATVQAEVTAMRGSYAEVFAHRWNYHHVFQSSFLYHVFVFDVFGMMLLGMGLMRAGFFDGTCRRWLHLAALGGGVLGVLVAGTLAFAWQQQGFTNGSPELWLARELTYPWTRALVALGWAALVVLAVRAGRAVPVTWILGSVGRLAFSNYVLQTVCCTLWFFGYGLGHYGTQSRSELMVVVLVVTAIQVGFSGLWSRWFRIGPLEWAWRSLTYWRLQPLR